MKVNFYDSTREYLQKKNEFDSAIQSILAKGNFILGEEVSQLEASVANFTGAKHGIGVASGTDALILAADILGFKDGKEVITSPFTFFASVSCLARNGAKPVFVDVDADTFNMDTNLIEDKITKNTAGILPVHLFLQMCDMDQIMSIAKKHDLKVLEDAAEAFGMRWKGAGSEYKHSGTIGDMGIFSFFPTKTLGSYGDAGMIVTNDDNLNELTKVYRKHGATKKYHHEYIGYNSRLDTIQAAILNVKMKYIDEAIAKRDQVATWYMDRLQDCEYIKFPKVKGDQKPVYYVFNILAEKRDELAAFLGQNGVGHSIYYPKPLHLQKCFDYLGYKKGDFPIAEMLTEKCLALPIYPEITEAEIDYVCETIKKFYNK